MTYMDTHRLVLTYMDTQRLVLTYMDTHSLKKRRMVCDFVGRQKKQKRASKDSYATKVFLFLINHWTKHNSALAYCHYIDLTYILSALSLTVAILLGSQLMYGVISYCCSLLDVTIGNFRLQRYISKFDKVNYKSNTLKFFVVFFFTCSVT